MALVIAVQGVFVGLREDLFTRSTVRSFHLPSPDTDKPLNVSITVSRLKVSP